MIQGQERTLKATIKSAESTAKKLKEQMQKMKASIQQIRAQAATDLRKKDVELSKLKSHLSDRQRGKRDGPTIINITGGAQLKQMQKSKEFEHQGVGGDAANRLKQETNEHLSRLCRELSDENDIMVNIVRNTIHTLKDVHGVADNTTEDNLPAPATQGNEFGRPRCDVLADEIARVLNGLKDLLMNSSYVPLEELEARDEEILRLREGWEKMEARWEEALKMMDNSSTNGGPESKSNTGLTHGIRRGGEGLQAKAGQSGREVGQQRWSDMEGPVQQKENIAPRRNLETEGRNLRSRLTKTATISSTGLITGSQLLGKAAAEELTAKTTDVNSADLETRSADSKPGLQPTLSPPKPPANTQQPGDNAKKETEKDTSTSRPTRRITSPKKSPVKSTQKSRVTKLAQGDNLLESSSSTPTPASQKSPTKTAKSVTIAPEETSVETKPLTQTPATRKLPEKQDSTKTNFSREETVVLQRNAEHKNITKRKREPKGTKGTKKTSTSRTTRSAAAANNPAPVKSNREKNTPETKATPLSNKRKATPVETQSRAKRRRSARLAELDS